MANNKPITWMSRPYSSIKELVKEKGVVDFETYRKRRVNDWSVTDALTTPPHANPDKWLKEYQLMWLYLTGKYSLLELKMLTGLSDNRINEILYRGQK